MTFRVGQKVVCVDDKPHARTRWSFKYLTKGAEYIIREVGLVTIQGAPGVRVEGVNLGDPRDNAIKACRFRPVVERGTDTGMAILRKLLKTKQREDA